MAHCCGDALMTNARRFMIAAALAATCSLPACSESLRVFAASSLTEPFTELGRRFSRAHPGNTVAFNFAGSQVLRTQIEQGAPADVFASADLDHMQALRSKHMVRGAVLFAQNSLTVVTPASEAKVKSLSDLARPGVRLVLAGENVPAGRYADQVLRSMDDSGRFGRDFRSRVMANVVSRELNVRSVLSKVTLGEADAAFVYVTDAATVRPRVKSIVIPARFNVIATYPVAVVAESRHKALATEFIRLLRGPEGRRILLRHGFRLPNPHGQSR
ncbi:MAG TPA: molybdate ABC transporter substrate-binding protein [Armatimonadota bacterium]|jgi:molybdate transport system substrate-binding protein